ncbi:MAG: 1-acyl-sn-glycerol-3-phosphate acyltransferase [Brachymonas sp.]|nr:1-acyl-sn-glycerol-3-phosphate acyltransferase [Brachymonas sp.]
MRSLLATVNLLRGIGHLFHGMWTIATRFSDANTAQRSEHIAKWSRGLLRLLNVTIATQGQPVQHGPMMVVLNHISWLDILVLLAAQPVCFVSKAEIKHWPLIGWLATQVGTLYIERASRRDAMRVVHQIADGLRAGQLIAVFPEGTTSDGSRVLPFHANLLQAAISAGCPVQPVALKFLEQNSQRSMSPVYIDDDTLLSSVWRMLKANPVTASLDFLPPVASQGQDRRALAAQLQTQITARINPDISPPQDS